jgi:hypothetical protein
MIENSVGEIWFGSVWTKFSQTRNQTIQFHPEFPKLKLISPKPKPNHLISPKIFETETKLKPLI